MKGKVGNKTYCCSDKGVVLATAVPVQLVWEAGNFFWGGGISLAENGEILGGL